uniref:Uncharacterized protein n=1 Tax=viral metagenome TaxID=1070528 RepID=A0A6C0L4D3_9ZZZZ|tara:strand:- start:1956 stop:2777 length:822 start_codon:yes stop_codon:yes gene_type:complete
MAGNHGDGEERNLYGKLIVAAPIIQYFLIFFIMYALSTILSETFGPMGNTFFCADLSDNKYFTGNTIMTIYLIACYTTIIGMREWISNTQIIGSRGDQRIEGFSDFVPYLVITIATFTYAGAYIRQKFSNKPQGGGSGLDWIDSKIKGTNYGVTSLYIGILLILVNFFSNVYMYLKNKKDMRRNKIARAIYYAQMTNMVIGAISLVFVLGFGCEFYMRSDGVDKFISVSKLIIVAFLIVFGVRLINKLTNTGHGPENWFGHSITEENVEASTM